MLVTTTPTIEGHEIIEYKGIVFGEVVSGMNFVKDFSVVLLMLLVVVAVLMKANFKMLVMKQLKK